MWFDSLREPKRFLIFLAIMLGWMIPLFIADIFSHNDLIRIPFGVVGGCWFFCVFIIALERTFGHIRK
jgi:predicted membrane channel-forming protein YqfA (hemolysin III family)